MVGARQPRIQAGERVSSGRKNKGGIKLENKPSLEEWLSLHGFNQELTDLVRRLVVQQHYYGPFYGLMTKGSATVEILWNGTGSMSLLPGKTYESEFIHATKKLQAQSETTKFYQNQLAEARKENEDLKKQIEKLEKKRGIVEELTEELEKVPAIKQGEIGFLKPATDLKQSLKKKRKRKDANPRL
jgi:cell division protein FtsB